MGIMTHLAVIKEIIRRRESGNFLLSEFVKTTVINTMRLAPQEITVHELEHLC